MSTLLMELHGNMELNHTIWPPHLFIYDDFLVYRKRRYFRVSEITLSYSHIVRVNFTKVFIFGHLELVTSADENVIVKFISYGKAKKAKKIIERKLYNALAKHDGDEVQSIASQATSYEKSLQRLNELLRRGRITNAEYKKKKADLLKNLR